MVALSNDRAYDVIIGTFFISRSFIPDDIE